MRVHPNAPLAPVFLSLTLLALAPAGAQTAPAAVAPAAQVGTTLPAAPKPPIDQRIQRIEVQDSGARINELRVGGETQNITVQPSNGMPAYEVVPANGARNRNIDERDGGAGSVGQRVWKLMSF